MFQQTLLYATFELVCLSFWLATKNAFWLLLLAFLLVRILFMREKIISFLIISSGVVFLWGHYIHKDNPVPQNFAAASLQVPADQIKVNGDEVRFEGRFKKNRTNQKVLAYYYCRTKAEKNYFSKNKANLNLLISGKRLDLRGPTNENQFNYPNFLAGKGIYDAIRVSTVNRIENDPGGIIFHLHSLRKKLCLKFQKMPFYLSCYSQALILGNNDKDYTEIFNSIRKLGIIYIFCLSGMHVFYLCFAIRRVGRWCGIAVEDCNLLLLLVLPAFLVLAGSAASLTRAVWMIWIMLFSREILKFPLPALTSWCLVLIINLCWTPAAICSLGFELSYLLTLGLMIWQEKNSIKLGIRLNCLSVPVLLWHTYQLNLLTIPLSFLIIPIFQYIMLPAVGLGVLCPFLWHFADLLLGGISRAFSFLAALPMEFTFGRPWLLGIVFAVITILAIEGLDQEIRQRMLFGIGIVLGINFFILHFPLKAEVVYFDIGQGDATLIRSRFNHRVYMIDTGGKVHFFNEKWRLKKAERTLGETVIANYLLSKGVSKLDGLFLTHQDTDHIGNYPSLTKKIKVNAVYVPWGMKENQNFMRKTSQADIPLERIYSVKDGVRFPDINLCVVHPFAKGLGKNEDSEALVYRQGSKTFFFSGDLDQNGEREVLGRYPNLDIDYLKLGHHGSKTSTSDQLLTQTKPQLALISAGRHNRYGHPSPETMEKLRQNKIPALNTAEDGMIKIENIAGQTTIKTMNKGVIWNGH